jgi:hypothetical protein
MKTIGTATILLFSIAGHCYGAGDAVPSLTKDDDRETTTFRRDGKTILKSTLYHSTEPERRMLRQQVILNDEVVMELSDVRGKRVFLARPRPHISVGIQQDSKTGVLEGVHLMDDSNRVIEVFEAKDSRLTPVSGKQLELTRAVTIDVSGLLAPESVKKTTPGEFRGRVKELVKKYKTNESDEQEGNRSNDRPPPHDPSPRREP